MVSGVLVLVEDSLWSSIQLNILHCTTHILFFPASSTSKTEMMHKATADKIKYQLIHQHQHKQQSTKNTSGLKFNYIIHIVDIIINTNNIHNYTIIQIIYTITHILVRILNIIPDAQEALMMSTFFFILDQTRCKL